MSSKMGWEEFSPHNEIFVDKRGQTCYNIRGSIIIIIIVAAVDLILQLPLQLLLLLIRSYGDPTRAAAGSVKASRLARSKEQSTEFYLSKEKLVLTNRRSKEFNAKKTPLGVYAIRKQWF